MAQAVVFFEKGGGKHEDSVKVKLGSFGVSSLPVESVERKLEAGGSQELHIEPVAIRQRADKAYQTCHPSVYEGDDKASSICVGKSEDHKNTQSKAECAKETTLSSSNSREKQLQIAGSERSYCQTAQAALSILSKHKEWADKVDVTEDDQRVFNKVKEMAIPIWQRIVKPDNDDGYSQPGEGCYLTEGEAALLGVERAISSLYNQSGVF